MHSHSGDQILLNEFDYRSLQGNTWQQWLHLIRYHTPNYSPGPYQQLAKAERAAGHEDNARKILIAQQRDLRRSGALGGWVASTTHLMWGALAGYGYRARRTAAALLLAVAIAGGLGWWAGNWVTKPGHHAAERVSTLADQTGTSCSFVEQFGIGIDRGLPLAAAGFRSRCDLDTATTAGQWFAATIWVVQVIVWAIAALALAGYTGLARKPN
jgi:hypothetical protein